ncbi:MAG: hypothetical protein V2I57_09310 [Xanthomonadales bacterium]|nr:hypothetical protein [Xanthomonadales bacterium]
MITGVSRGNPLETGLRYFRGLEQGFAAIEAGRFEDGGETLVLSCRNSDGDGSICKARELRFRDRVLQGIEIRVTPAL